eukprot:CFRG6316T1
MLGRSAGMFRGRAAFTVPNFRKTLSWSRTVAACSVFSQRYYSSDKKEYRDGHFLSDLAKESKFGLIELQALRAKFLRRGKFDSHESILLTEPMFARAMTAIGVTDGHRVKHYFKLFDRDGNGEIDFRELVSGLNVLLRGKTAEFAQSEFSLWDLDGNGVMDKDEFRRYIRSTYTGSLEPSAVEGMADATFDRVDVEGNGSITFSEFKQALLQNQLGTDHEDFTLQLQPMKGLARSEIEVLQLVGERFHLKPGESPENRADERCAFFLFKGEGELKFKDTLDHGDRKISSTTPATAFFAMRELFVDSKALLRFVATTPCDVIKIPRDDISALALNNHKGATTLIERMGTLMYERTMKSKERIEEKQKEGATTEEELEFLQEHKNLLLGYALKFHSLGKKGKLEIVPTKNIGSASALSIAYSPGVAEPCLAIKNNHDFSYEYTTRGHLVGVITNGTAVLGLGNIGALASKPVMEGKAVLFKQFGGVDSFDVEIDQNDPDKLIDTIVSLEPTFGGINLEDIKAPECFYIEAKCQERMSIPVMHDDQHGTAIIAGAGLLNAARIAGKNLADIKVVVNGCGAAGFTCAKHFVRLGVKKENVICCDIDGVIYKERADLVADPNLYLHEVATETSARFLADAIDGADAFCGLSAPNCLTPEMLLKMNASPLIFALANPTPEIDYNLAMQTRDDCIMGTGRSDLPNQINNVCAFPYIFRGALDVRATMINEEMKMAATQAIAYLARSNPNFGPTHIIPSPLDPSLLYTISPAVAAAAMSSGVARIQVDIGDYTGMLKEKQTLGSL